MIKKKLLLFAILLVILPEFVYAYSKLSYYDFAYIMNKKGYSIVLNVFQVIAVDNTSDDDIKSEYYYYNFYNEDDAKKEINYFLNELKEKYNVFENLHELDDSSYFEGDWNVNGKDMYKYCFRYVGNIVCGVGDVQNEEKIKSDVDDLFRDDVYDVYSLEEIHEKIKDMDVENLSGVLHKIGVFGIDESISSNDNLSKKDKDNKISSIIYLGIGIVVVSALFGVIGLILLKRKEKTS